MPRNSIRRLAAVTATAGLVAAGVTVGLGAGTASAATTCAPSSTATKDEASTVWIKYTYTKSVSVSEAAAGSLVTYKTVFSTESPGNPYLNRITDYPPAGFGAPVSAKLTAYTVAAGQKTYDVVPVADGAGYKVTSDGWFVNSGNPVTLEMTYQVPEDVTVGDQITSGGISTSGTVGSGASFPNLTSCFTVREKNAVEAGAGSLEEMGIGAHVLGSLTDPQGSISNVVGGVLDNVLANMS